MSYLRERSLVFVDNILSSTKHACVIGAFEHEKVSLDEWGFLRIYNERIACSTFI